MLKNMGWEYSWWKFSVCGGGGFTREEFDGWDFPGGNFPGEFSWSLSD